MEKNNFDNKAQNNAPDENTHSVISNTSDLTNKEMIKIHITKIQYGIKDDITLARIIAMKTDRPLKIPNLSAFMNQFNERMEKISEQITKTPEVFLEVFLNEQIQ